MFLAKLVRLASPLAVVAVTCTASGQCWQFEAPDPAPGILGSVGWVGGAVRWDPDGPGPSPAVLAVAGIFTQAGNVGARGVAVWDGAAWTPLGAGLPNSAWNLAAGPNGELFAGGSFGLRRWTGAAWQEIPMTNAGGGSGEVYAMMFMPDGGLVVTGRLATVAGTPVSGIARWDGQAWSGLGAGLDSLGTCLTVMADGGLLVGGRFESAGGVPARHIARWDGAGWSSLGAGLDGEVWAVLERPDGSIVAGGGPLSSQGVALTSIAAWDGVRWGGVGEGLAGWVYALAPSGAEGFVAGGSFSGADAERFRHVARWTGAGWAAMGVGIGAGVNGDVTALLELPTGELLAVGDFTEAGGWPALGLGWWTDEAWRPCSAAPYAESVSALAVRGGSQVLAGGVFSTYGSLHANRIASRSPSGWTLETTAVNGSIDAVRAMPDGSLIAAGNFTEAGGVGAAHIARWDGAAWSPLGPGLDGRVLRLAVAPDGDLIAGGVFLHAGGLEVNRIARWDGRAWSALGSGVPGSPQIAVLPNGGVVASPGPASRVALWDGAAWTDLGFGQASSGQVTTITVAENGDLYLSGDFGVENCWGLARFHGGAWSGLGSGLRFPERAYSAAAMADGSVMMVGDITSAGYATARGMIRCTSDAASNAAAGPLFNARQVVALDDGTVAVTRNPGVFGLGRLTSEESAPEFTLEPEDRLVCAGSAVTLSALARADGPITYRWYDDSGTLLGTGPSVTITAPASRQRRSYTCVASAGSCPSTRQSRFAEIKGVSPDVDRSGFLDFFDYIFFQDAFRLGGMPVADFNNDGFIDFFDYMDFLDFFERGC